MTLCTSDTEVEGEPCFHCFVGWELDSENDVCPSDCDCGCHDAHADDSPGNEDVIHVRPPISCLHGHCTDYACEFCANFGLSPSQNEAAYIDEPELDAERQRQDDEERDNDELFDTAENMGMLYETVEPSILLACTEIRSALNACPFITRTMRSRGGSSGWTTPNRFTDFENGRTVSLMTMPSTSRVSLPRVAM